MITTRTIAGRSARAAVVMAVALLVSREASHAQSPADSAWVAGDTRLAGELYHERLAADSTDELALHRLALMWAWDARYEESLELFGHLLRISPANMEARVDRAKVMAWSGDLSGAIKEIDRVLEADPSYVPALAARARYEAWRGDLTSAIAIQNELLGVAPEDRDVWRSQATYLVWDDRVADAIVIYDSLLQSDPTDRSSRLGKATALSWSNRLEEASSLYAEMLEADSTDVDAWAGYARVAAWDGRLIDAEDRWRRAVTLAPDQPSIHAGLGQTLRWQGRDAASYRELMRATELAPGNREASEELSALRLDQSPKGTPGILFTSDSDQNDIFTVEGDATWHPTRSIEMRAEAYYRELLDSWRGVHGEIHPRVLATLTQLININNRVGDTAAARSYTERLLDARRRAAQSPQAEASAREAYARLLLTCEPPDLRNPETALQFARQATEMTDDPQPESLATLALALFQTGEAFSAIEMQKRAISLVPETESSHRAALQKRLAEFEAASGHSRP